MENSNLTINEGRIVVVKVPKRVLVTSVKTDKHPRLIFKLKKRV